MLRRPQLRRLASAAAAAAPPRSVRRRATPWTAQEKSHLQRLMASNAERTWPQKAAALGTGRSANAVMLQWRQVLDPALRKGPWTAEESALLEAGVAAHGEGSWEAVAAHVGSGRSGTACHVRWTMVLTSKKGEWDGAELARLRQAVPELLPKLAGRGRVWKAVAERVGGGRSGSQCRKRWNQLQASREAQSGAGKRRDRALPGAPGDPDDASAEKAAAPMDELKLDAFEQSLEDELDPVTAALRRQARMVAVRFIGLNSAAMTGLSIISATSTIV